MQDAASYQTIEQLRDGTKIEVRALRPGDKADLISAIGRVGAQSLYRRFLGPRREFSDREIDFYVRIDFVSHVALIAVAEERGKAAIVGAGRYIVVKPGTAELAFAVIDQYQGRGIGSTLLRHLIAIARGCGINDLVADVLADNTPMLKTFARSGLPMSSRSEASTVHVRLRLV